MPRTHRLHRTLAALVILGSGAGRADHFVITATEDSKDLAQKQAAEKGGWVLDTNLYAALAPNKYSVVRGPFAKPGDAQQELKLLQSGQRYPGAYVKDAGKIRISALFGGKSTPAIAAALLGELHVTLNERPGGGNPCEPQEPYVDVQLSFMSPERTADGTGEAVRRKIDFGSLTIINRTGEIQHMRVCGE
jgi:hypothetical protein